MKWVNADAARTEKYGNALSLIENAVKKQGREIQCSAVPERDFQGLMRDDKHLLGQMTALEEALTERRS